MQRHNKRQGTTIARAREVSYFDAVWEAGSGWSGSALGEPLACNTGRYSAQNEQLRRQIAMNFARLRSNRSWRGESCPFALLAGDGWLYNLRAWTTNRSRGFFVKPRNYWKLTARSLAGTEVMRRLPN